MALTKCPDCGKEISDKADACPNCGCPIYKEKKGKGKKKEKDKKESVESILSLVFYFLSGIFAVSESGLMYITFIACVVLTIIAHLKKDSKCVCATIVVWLTTIGIVLSIIVACLYAATF